MPTRAEYAKINIACKELGIDKAALLYDRYKLSSSKDLNRAQTWDLLDHLKKLGFTVKRGKKGSPSYPRRDQRKVVALWISLAQEKVIKNRGDKALQTYVKRMTGCDNLAFCEPSHCSVLIDALKAWGVREGVELD